MKLFRRKKEGRDKPDTGSPSATEPEIQVQDKLPDTLWEEPKEPEIQATQDELTDTQWDEPKEPEIQAQDELTDTLWDEPETETQDELTDTQWKEPEIQVQDELTDTQWDKPVAEPEEPTEPEVQDEIPDTPVAETTEKPPKKKSFRISFQKKPVSTSLPEYDVERDGYLLDPPTGRNYVEIDSYWIQKGVVQIQIVNTLANEYYYVVREPKLTPFEKDVLERIHEEVRNLVVMEDIQTTEDQVAAIERTIDRLFEKYQIVPEPATVYKLRYYVKRNMLGWGRIDALRRDPTIEDISCDGYKTPVFLFHRKYRNIRTSIIFEDEKELDSIVVLFAQRSGKHISYAQPIVDTSLSDGSRAQLTYGNEVSSHGSSFTIRKFREIPFSPIDLIMNHTYTVEEMAYLWMAVEYNQSILFIGGTASGKTTALNAVAQYIPHLSKIVTIEDTREIRLRHENWLAAVTPEASNVAEVKNEITMFDLLKAAMRQRPEYILVGEVRGIEAQTLFQAMNTGHTTFSTLHAGNVDSAIHRLGNEPLNVPRATMESLNIVVSQIRMYREGNQIRRCNEIVEIAGLSEDKNVIVNAVFKYRPSLDLGTYSGRSEVFSRIAEQTGRDLMAIETEWDTRKKILGGMVQKKIHDYRDVSHLLWIYSALPKRILDSLEDLTVLLHDGTERAIDAMEDPDQTPEEKTAPENL